MAKVEQSHSGNENLSAVTQHAAPEAPLDSLGFDSINGIGSIDRNPKDIHSFKSSNPLYDEINSLFETLREAQSGNLIAADFTGRSGGFSIRKDSDGELIIFVRGIEGGVTIAEILSEPRTAGITGDQLITRESDLYATIDRHIFPHRYLFDIARADITVIDANGKETLVKDLAIGQDLTSDAKTFTAHFHPESECIDLTAPGLSISKIEFPLMKIKDAIGDEHLTHGTILPYRSPFASPEAYLGHAVNLVYEYQDEPGNRIGSKPVVLENYTASEHGTVLNLKRLDDGRSITLKESAHNIISVTLADRHAEIPPLFGTVQEAADYMVEHKASERPNYESGASNRKDFLEKHFLVGTEVEVTYTQTLERNGRGGSSKTTSSSQTLAGRYAGTGTIPTTPETPAILILDEKNSYRAIPLKDILRVIPMEATNPDAVLWSQ